MFCLPRFTPWLLASFAICLLFTPPAMAQRVKKKLTVTMVPSSVSVGGTVTGTVTHNTSTGSDVYVSLTSSTAGAVTMPAKVTINAGQVSASFTVTAGTTPQSVTITASADGFQSGSAGLTIEAASLGKYEVRWLGYFEGDTTSYAISANSSGEVVGSSRTTVNGSSVNLATRFKADGPYDLNLEMADLLSWRTDGPWRAWRAKDINDFGQIVGDITKSPGSRAFVYDPGNVTGQRSLTIVEHPDGWPTNVGGINNWGQIVGSYTTDSASVAFVANPPDYQIIDLASGYQIDGGQGKSINDMGQLAFGNAGGEALRYTPVDDFGGPYFDIFPFHIREINERGVVAGMLRTEVKKGGKTQFTYSIYRAASPDAVQTIYQGTANSWSPSLNDHLDVAFTQNNRLLLHRDVVGQVSVDSLVADTKWKNSNNISCYKLLNPLVDGEGNVGLPMIVGAANISLGVTEAFILIPTIP